MKKFIVIMLAVLLVCGNLFAEDTESLENRIGQLTKRIEYLESLLSDQNSGAATETAQPAEADAKPAIPPQPAFPGYHAEDMRALERRIRNSADAFFSWFDNGFDRCRGRRFRNPFDMPSFDMGWGAEADDFGFQSWYVDENGVKQLISAKASVKAEVDVSTVALNKGDLIKVVAGWSTENQSGKQSCIVSVDDIAKQSYDFSLALSEAPGTIEASVVRGNDVVASATLTVDKFTDGSTYKVAFTPAE